METVTNFITQYVINPILTITLVDILDIVLLAFLFYFVYRFIRDRRAGKVALGVLLILFILIISSAFEMHAINFVLKNFYQVGIMALLIVFQPELRAMVERLGSTSFRKLGGIRTEARSRSALTSASLDEIVLAVKHMSFSKTGALACIFSAKSAKEKYKESSVMVR